MKKILSALLAISMLLACMTALAEAGEAGAGEFYQELGLTLNIQSILDNCENYFSIESEGVTDHDPYIASARLTFYAIPTANIVALYENASNEEEAEIVTEFINSICTPIGRLYVTDALDLDAKELEWAPGMKAQEIGAYDNWRYIYVTASVDNFLAEYDNLEAFGTVRTEAEAKAAKELAAAEIEKVNSIIVDMVKASAHVTPEDPDGVLIGQTLQFETTDLDGNAVRSEDLFKDNKITLVNLWGSWCPSCVAELPDLVALHKRLQQKGCGVVGVEYEYEAPEEYRSRADQIIAEAGINYPNVLRPDGNPIFSKVYGYPTSYLVDSEGKILTYPIGIWSDGNEEIVDKLLAGESVDLGPDNGATPGNGEKYCVYVFDTDGKPVEGAIIQLCDEKSCTFQRTDANGLAAFEGMEQKVYDIHVLKVPEGFRQDEKSYQTLETYSDVSIFLDRAE